MPSYVRSCRVDGNRIVLVGTSTKLFIILYIISVLNVLRLLSKVGHPSKLIISDTLAYLLIHIELHAFGPFLLHVHNIDGMVTKLHRHILILDEQASNSTML